MRAVLNFEHRCSLKCEWCYIPFGRPAPELEVSRKVLGRLLDHGVTEITIGGGDPTTYRYWYDIVADAKRAGAFVHLDTNGIGLRQSPQALETLKSHVDLLGLPLDGPDALTHGSVRGSYGHFDLVLDRLRWVKSIGPDIKINTVVTKKNFASLARTANLVESLGPKIWSVYEYWPLGDGGARRQDWEQPDETLKEAIDRLPKFVGKTRVEPNLRYARRMTYPIVSHEGSVYVHSDTDVDRFKTIGSIFNDGVLSRAFSLCTGDRRAARDRYEK